MLPSFPKAERKIHEWPSPPTSMAAKHSSGLWNSVRARTCKIRRFFSLEGAARQPWDPIETFLILARGFSIIELPLNKSYSMTLLNEETFLDYSEFIRNCFMNVIMIIDNQNLVESDIINQTLMFSWLSRSTRWASICARRQEISKTNLRAQTRDIKKAEHLVCLID